MLVIPLLYTYYLLPLFLLLLSTIVYMLYRTVQITPRLKLSAIITGTGILVWFLIAYIVAIQNYFTDPDGFLEPGPTALVLIMLGIIFFSLPPLKQLIKAIPLHLLLLPQVARLIGGVFILAFLSGQLPEYWALTAGWGDIAVGVFTPFVVYASYQKIRHWKTYVLLFSLFSLFDVVHALTIAFLSHPSPFQLFHTVPNFAVTGYFPVLLVIIFGMPLDFVLQIFTLMKLKQEK